MRKTRKPTLMDKVEGCIGCVIQIIIGVFTFNHNKVELYKMLFVHTAKGQFEIEEE
ncbi:MAG: hypothetical protein IJV71_12075 [Lachnospiraceae bacterium]|nr:hypothetical protein [Lachnospiraceae bacterium]